MKDDNRAELEIFGVLFTGWQATVLVVMFILFIFSAGVKLGMIL